MTEYYAAQQLSATAQADPAAVRNQPSRYLSLSVQLLTIAHDKKWTLIDTGFVHEKFKRFPGSARNHVK
jgi:hypothetical protein